MDAKTAVLVAAGLVVLALLWFAVPQTLDNMNLHSGLVTLAATCLSLGVGRLPFFRR